MTWLDYLPAVLREPDADDPDLLGGLLTGLEAVMTGAGDAGAPGLEELLDGIDGPPERSLSGLERLFTPLAPPGEAVPERHQAPADFLDWLSDWVALAVRADVTEAQQRALIANAVPLYAQRGTPAGLAAILALYDVGVVIEEDLDAMQIGDHSTIGQDTRIGGGAPHSFRVTLNVPTPDPDRLRDTERRLTAIIDAEKPAHTVYQLTSDTPPMQIGVRSTIGVDTMLGASED